MLGSVYCQTSLGQLRDDLFGFNRCLHFSDDNNRGTQHLWPFEGCQVPVSNPGAANEFWEIQSNQIYLHILNPTLFQYQFSTSLQPGAFGGAYQQPFFVPPFQHSSAQAYANAFSNHFGPVGFGSSASIGKLTSFFSNWRERQIFRFTKPLHTPSKVADRLDSERLRVTAWAKDSTSTTEPSTEMQMLRARRHTTLAIER